MPTSVNVDPFDPFEMEIDNDSGTNDTNSDSGSLDSDAEYESDESENLLNSSAIHPPIPIPNNHLTNYPPSPMLADSPGFCNNDLPECAHKWQGYVSSSPSY